MRNYPLVSILTPCYNGENFLFRLFDSILAQDYPHMEFIFVDDGSTDRTKEKAMSYADAFLKKGIDFQYYYQENAGQAAALNCALSHAKGKYFIWPDSDDWLMEGAVSLRVDFLEQHPNCPMVRSDGAYYSEQDLNTPLRPVAHDYDKKTKSIFEDLIYERTYCCCGCYMMRASAFFKVHPSGKILEARGGQNWQMEIPVSYLGDCGYIDKVLYGVLDRVGSHHRQNRTVEEQLCRNEDLYQIKVWSIMRVCQDKALLKNVDTLHTYLAFKIAYEGNDRAHMKQYYQKLAQTTSLSRRTKFLYVRGQYPLVGFLCRVLLTPIRKWQAHKRKQNGIDPLAHA